MFVFIVSWLLVMVMLLLAIAFLTLLERKVMAFVQTRLAPVKVGLGGILQPLLDGLKLLVKPNFWKSHISSLLYWSMSLMSLMLSFVMWYVVPFESFDASEFQIFWLLAVSGLASYVMLLAGVASLSKYSQLGGLRSLSQSFSYEVVLTLLVFLPFLMNQLFCWNSFGQNCVFIWGVVWFLSLLMETQKAPFDLAEGESELVSGFNTEYGSLFFVYFFLAEYGNILILSMFTVLFFLKFSGISLCIILVWLCVRVAYPRLRYDFVMGLMWYLLLPFILWVWLVFLNW